MTRWKLLTKLPNGNELSTVELPYPYGVFESCWFYSKGNSMVVAQYQSKAEAIKGHTSLVCFELLVEEVN